MIFLQHVNTVLGRLRENPVTALSTAPDEIAYKVQTAINLAVAKVWNAKQWSFKQRKITLAVTSGDSDGELPKTVGEVYLVLSSIDPFWLSPVDEDDLDRYIPDPQASGNPEVIAFTESVGAVGQPAAAATLDVVSSASADTTQVVLIKGLVGGEVDYEAVTLNGTSTVTTTKSFTQVEAITKSAETTGRVTVTAGAVTILVIAPKSLTTRLRKFRIYPEASASFTLTFKYFKEPPILTHAYEDTEIPARWDNVVNQWAFALSLEVKGQDQQAEFREQITVAQQMLNDMSAEEKQSSMRVIVPAKMFDVNTRLGDFNEPPSGWYPQQDY